MACRGLFFLLWCCSHVRPLNHVAESLVVSIGAQSGVWTNLPNGFIEKMGVAVVWTVFAVVRVCLGLC